MKKLVGEQFGQLYGVASVGIEDLRTALLRISDASMDAVEVEEKSVCGCDEDEEGIGYHTKNCDMQPYGWNAARTASREKRTLFVK